MTYLELTIESTNHQGRIIEFYERHQNTRSVYQFFLPRKKTEGKTMREITVGLTDGYYHEGDYEPFDARLFETLNSKRTAAQILEVTRQTVGASMIVTEYYNLP